MERRNWHASQESERASNLSARDAREMVVLAVAGAYLETIAIDAGVGSQRAQVENAQAVYHQAEVRKEAGTNARIDVTRTLVELQGQQQRLNALESDLRKQKLALARLIGIPLDRELILSEQLAFNPPPVPEAAGAVQQAFQKRWDLQAAASQVRAAEIVVSAARAERLPSGSISADYGVLGPSPVTNHGVYSVVGSINVPIYQGGRVKADIEQAEATLHQRQAELADQRGRVEQEVRTALIELETAIGEVRLAESNRGFANETLREARDRFNAGVTTTVEVVQAQEQVASAESDYFNALFAFDLARISLSRAMGEAETDLPSLLERSSPMSSTRVPTPAPGTAGKKPAPVTRGRGRHSSFSSWCLLIAAGVGIYFWLQSRQFESTDDAQVEAHLNSISSRVDGTITHVYVDNNQIVKAGDPLVDLDPRDFQVDPSIRPVLKSPRPAAR